MARTIESGVCGNLEYRDPLKHMIDDLNNEKFK